MAKKTKKSAAEKQEILDSAQPAIDKLAETANALQSAIAKHGPNSHLLMGPAKAFRHAWNSACAHTQEAKIQETLIPLCKPTLAALKQIVG